MGQYVFSKELGSEAGVSFSIEVFKESKDEYRPILTASDDDYNSGFSKRRSFPSETEAKTFYQDNEAKMKQEALREVLAARGRANRPTG